MTAVIDELEQQADTDEGLEAQKRDLLAAFGNRLFTKQHPEGRDCGSFAPKLARDARQRLGRHDVSGALLRGEHSFIPTRRCFADDEGCISIGLQDIVLGTLVTQQVSGDHHSILKYPNVVKVAEAIDGVLAAFDATEALDEPAAVGA